MNSEIYYEDVEIGDDIGPVRRIINKKKVEEFLRLRGGPFGLNRFTDDASAGKEGLPGAIIPGGMNIAMVSQLLTGWSSTITLKKLDVIFRQVVLHNRPLHLKGIVTDKNVVDGEPQLACDVFLVYEEGMPLLIGHAIVALPMKTL